MGLQILLTSTVFTLTAAVTHAQTLDFTTAVHPSTAGARDAVAADFNRDGWTDLATANWGRNTVAILLNRGDGTGFDPVREYAVGAGPFDIDAGDLNGDAIADLIVTTPDARAIDVLLFGIDGHPASRATIAAGSEAWGATLADVTRDGALDLIYTDHARGRVVLLAGDRVGGFAATGEWAVSARPQGIAAADLNHDGRIDLVVVSTTAPALDILYGASGGFTRRTVPAGRSLNVVSIADMNADGWAEIAAAATGTNVVAIFSGSPGGVTLAGTRPVGSSPRGIAAADFNQDGRPDLAVSNYGSGTVTVLLGRRDGSVLPDVWDSLPSGAGARGIAASDFDHDGRLDVAVAAQSAPRVTLHANDTPFVQPALSFTRHPTGLYYGPEAIADFNENGRPDLVTDVAVLLDGTTQVRLPQETNVGTLAVDAADFTRDGHQDVLVLRLSVDSQGHISRSFLQLFVGDGRGGLAPPRNIEGLPTGLEGFRTADVDSDGHLDVLAYTTADVVLIRRVGSSPSAQLVISNSSILGLEIGDVTLDGSLDAVIATYDGFRLYAGAGAGSFDEGVSLGGHAAPRFALGDINHDGRLDLVSDGGSVINVMLSTQYPLGPQVSYDSWVPFDTGQGTILGDFDHDGHLDVLTYGGAMLFGDGQGAFGRMRRFAFEPDGGIAYDYNRDGLLDIVHAGEVLLNERRAANRPPIANAGPDRTYEFRDHINDDEWCERTTPSFDPDLHRVLPEWRDETGTRFGCAMPPHAPGTYTFTLTVRDDLGGSSSDTMRVTIRPAPEIVLHPGQAWDKHGTWISVADPDAASGVRLYHPPTGAPKSSAPAASPTDYVDLWFAADPTQTYKLWVRLKADGDYWGNDSVWLQFDGAVVSDGGTYAVGSTMGLAINLEECSGCGISGWGWEDDGWGARNRNGLTLRFPQGGIRRVRVQVREDGVSIDQIVLSAVQYRTVRPGAAKNDATILPPTQ